MNRKPLSKEEFEYFYQRMPRITVEVVIVHKGGVVLTKRTVPPDKGFWHIPGGSVMVGETLEDAVVAVAKDELGVEVSVNKFLRFFYYPEILEQVGYWPIGAGFLAEIKSGELRVDEDASKVKVFKEIPRKIVPDQKEFLVNLADKGFQL